MFHKGVISTSPVVLHADDTVLLSLQLGGGGGGMDSLGGLGDIFGAASSSSYVPPAEVRISAKCRSWSARLLFCCCQKLCHD